MEYVGTTTCAHILGPGHQNSGSLALSMHYLRHLSVQVQNVAPSESISDPILARQMAKPPSDTPHL
jgi:hypothetical protein